MANVIIDVAAEFTGKKAFKDAGSATSSLEKSVKTLGKTIGITFSAKAIVDFSKAAVKAFAEDDRAIRVLRTNLKNLGLAYQSVNADNFIKNMETQAAVSDDLLRPAYAQLAKVTLSTTKTQDLMALAFDLSAANGIDFASTVDILSNAYVGNYKGLKQLYTGLTQAQLASKSFEEIQAILTKQSKGAGKAALDTYAGSVDKLSIASDNAKESIGKGLVDLFAALAGNGNIDQATANINTFSSALGQMLSDASKYGAIDWLSALVTGNVTEGTAQKLVKRPSARRFFTGGSGVSTELLTARKEAAAEAARLKAIKAAAAAKIAADKKAAAQKAILAKADSMFNMERIQIEAALKGKISDDEKLRLELQKAILNEDFDLADKLQKKLEASQRATAALQGSINGIKPPVDPFAGMLLTLESVITALGKIGMAGSSVGGTKNVPKEPIDTIDLDDKKKDPDKKETVVTNNPPPEVIVKELPPEPPTTNNPFGGLGGSTGGFGFSLPKYLQDQMPQQPVTVNVNVEGSILSQDTMVKVVADALVVANTNGNNTRRPGAVIEID
jgi:precorrin-6B methylase 2